jgi:plasmid maintenance system antidote protein VapI
MEETLKGQLHSLYSTYSAINAQFKRIESEATRLETERKTVSEVLHNTRELEKEVINNLENILGKKLTPNDILEIIKQYE